MKLVLCAVALAFAAPAVAAQSAPAAPAADHGQMDHSKMDHGQHKDAKAPSEEHKHMCQMMKDGKKMACCEHGDQKAKAPAAHGDHGGH
jgi:Ni/Co efflux regulator RcnB